MDIWLEVPVVQLTSYVTLVISLSRSGLQFIHVHIKDIIYPASLSCIWGKGQEGGEDPRQCLAQDIDSVRGNCYSIGLLVLDLKTSMKAKQLEKQSP